MKGVDALSAFSRTHETETVPLTVNQRRFRFLKPRHIDDLIDALDPYKDFPLWAKIWEAALVLAGYMADRPVDPREHILEVGAGLGVAGLVAAAFGHRVTITEYDPRALAYIEANRVLNACHAATVHRLDWLRPDLEGRFDMIIGSEIVYNNKHIDFLAQLFKTHLHPGGSVVLAEGVRATGLDFWQRMDGWFDIRVKKHTLRGDSEKVTLLLFEMRRKQTLAAT
jgi:predicted nicotinamide N-methyase